MGCSCFHFFISSLVLFFALFIAHIIVINKKVGTLNGKVISQAQVFVEVGKDVKEYILDEDQYERLMNCIKRMC